MASVGRVNARAVRRAKSIQREVAKNRDAGLFIMEKRVLLWLLCVPADQGEREVEVALSLLSKAGLLLLVFL